jgi:hypothetical protein
MAKIEVSGADEVAAFFLSLPPKMSDALRSAANTGASVIKEEVIARAPRDKGILADNIYQKHIPEQSGDAIQTYHVSWRKKGKGDIPYYGAWVEYGHWFVPPKPKGITWKKHRTATKSVFVPAHPFLRPGYEAKKDAALEAMQAKLAENVMQVIGDAK